MSTQEIKGSHKLGQHCERTKYDNDSYKYVVCFLRLCIFNDISIFDIMNPSIKELSPTFTKDKVPTQDFVVYITRHMDDILGDRTEVDYICFGTDSLKVIFKDQTELLYEGACLQDAIKSANDFMRKECGKSHPISKDV